MLADEETVEMHAAGAATGPHDLLVASAALPMSVELDVLDEHTAAMYWARSDRFDTVLDLSFARRPGCPVPGAGGLDPAFSGAAVRIQPAPRIDDERWVWHIGLDAEASGVHERPVSGRGDRRGAARPPARAVPPGVPRSRRYARSGARKSGDTNVATSFKKKDGGELNAGTGHAGRRSAGKSPGH